MPKTTKPRRDIAAEVTAKIIEALKGGTIPWQQPWVGGAMPTSLSTGRPYRGVNVFILGITGQLEGYSSPWWGTYNQINERGGQVTKGQKSTSIILWRPVEKKDAAGTVVERFMVLRAYNVFNAEQAEWPEGSRLPVAPDAPTGAEALAHCDEMVADYLATGPTLRHGGDAAAYSPRADLVMMPEQASFTSTEGYYSTLFHELTHSTGAEKRLNREGIVEGHRFGDTSYAKEELIAEMGAAMLCGMGGIEQETFDRSAAYIANWIKALDNDPNMIVRAGAAAQRATDLLTSATFDEATKTDDNEEVAA